MKNILSGIYTSIFLVNLSLAALACEDQPNPYVVLSRMDRDFKGYATQKDYLASYKSTKDYLKKAFKKLDRNNDQKLTVDEINKDQVAYQLDCKKKQLEH